jgi:predicted transcriptional regulator
VPPKQSATLTEAELRIMEVLWRRGSGTVQQVLDWLGSALAYNSVLTTIRTLEKKGHVRHVKDGRAHVYEPVIGREDATRSEVRHLVGRFFRNSHEALILNILQDDAIDAADLKRLRAMLERSDARGVVRGDAK